MFTAATAIVGSSSTATAESFHDHDQSYVGCQQESAAPSAATSRAAGGVAIYTFQDAAILRDAAISRTSSSFQQNIAMIASAATSSWGVSLEQMVEPIALASSPQSSVSFEEVANWKQWLTRAAKQSAATTGQAMVAATPKADESKLRRQLDALAKIEPIDAKRHVPAATVSVISLVGAGPMLYSVPDVEIDATAGLSEAYAGITAFVDALRGPEDRIAQLILGTWNDSAPATRAAKPRIAPEPSPVGRVIAKEAYMPYDVAKSDLPLWGYSPLNFGRGHGSGHVPLVMKPYCIRHRAVFDEIRNPWELGDDEAAIGSAVAAPADVDLSGIQFWSDVAVQSASTVSDTQSQFVRNAEFASTEITTLIARHRSLAKPVNLGRRASVLAETQVTLAQRIGNALAKLPLAKRDVEPVVPATNRLLARAGATADETAADRSTPLPLASIDAAQWEPLVDGVMSMIGKLNNWRETIAVVPVASQTR